MLNRRDVQALTPYVLVGIVVWVCVLKSGVHATLAGVVVGFAVPLTGKGDDGSPLERAEHALHPWVAFGVLPLFAFANAGVSFAGASMGKLVEAVPLGIAAGLFIGKQIGVFGATWLAVKAGIARLPEGASWGADLGRRIARRHRLHDEPVHRHAGVRGAGASGRCPNRRDGGIAGVGDRGLRGAAMAGVAAMSDVGRRVQ